MAECKHCWVPIYYPAEPVRDPDKLDTRPHSRCTMCGRTQPFNKARKYCTSFADKPGKVQCCGSCHDDAELGYCTEMCEFEDDTTIYTVCCKVHDWLHQPNRELQQVLADALTDIETDGEAK